VPAGDRYFYTFTWVDDNDEAQDLSLIGNTLTNDDNRIMGVFNNSIGACFDHDSYLDVHSLQVLPHNIFINSYGYDGFFFYGCYSNHLGANCAYNTFGNACNNTILGTHCINNILDHNCTDNTFAPYCKDNTLGHYCGGNDFGTSCSYNTFKCNCGRNTFKSGCEGNILDENCMYNVFEPGVSYITLMGESPNDFAAPLRDIKVSQGVHGTSLAQRIIPATRGLYYQIVYKAPGSTEIILD
jgi:hypothetical protein